MTKDNRSRFSISNAPDLWPSVSYELLEWEHTGEEVGSRRALRQAKEKYQAAVPAPIAAATPLLTSETLAIADDASQELARFDTEVGTLAAPYASILLRTESAASSEVEHLTATAQQVALAQIGEPSTKNAALIVANVSAMRAAIDRAGHLDAASIIAMHDELLRETNPLEVGHWRIEQAWLGGGFSPHAASFVPPHPGRVNDLMADLTSFTQRTDIPVLALTALAHAQFETIHPFPAGNGRTGRALLQGMLRHGGLTRHATVPISAGLLHDKDAYFAALRAYREGNPNAIVTALAEAVFVAVASGRELVADAQEAVTRWNRVATARRDSSVHRAKAYLVRQPVVNTKTLATKLDISEVAAQNAINKLTQCGVLSQIGAGDRNRVWGAPEILNALDDFGERARRSNG